VGVSELGGVTEPDGERSDVYVRCSMKPSTRIVIVYGVDFVLEGDGELVGVQVPDVFTMEVRGRRGVLRLLIVVEASNTWECRREPETARSPVQPRARLRQAIEEHRAVRGR
jgi:hypothetical protein